MSLTPIPARRSSAAASSIDNPSDRPSDSPSERAAVGPEASVQNRMSETPPRLRASDQ